VGFNKRRMDRERAAALRAEEEQRRRELGRDSAQAQRLVSVWNSRAARRARPSFYPTIETAMLAGTPWLSYLCPACQRVGEVDLRALDRHPLTPISGLSRCRAGGAARTRRSPDCLLSSGWPTRQRPVIELGESSYSRQTGENAVSSCSSKEPKHGLRHLSFAHSALRHCAIRRPPNGDWCTAPP
jgi:hypothetical protein